MKHTGKRVLSMLCTLTMLLSLMAMIVPGASAAEESLVFKAEDISLAMASAGIDTVIYDPTSQYGDVVKLSAENRAGDSWLHNMMFYPLGSGKTLPFYANDGTDVLLGRLTDVQIQENAAAGEYVTYTFGGLDLSGATFMYTFDWTVRINFTAEQQSWLQGKTVDMVVAMKVTGDVTDAQTSNPPVFYIDYISFTEKKVEAVGGIHKDHLLYAQDYTVFPEKPEQNTSYVDDAEAYGGRAVRHLDADSGISITRYHGAESKIGTLSAQELVNKGYQVHKFTYTVPADAATGGFVFVMSNWQFQSPALSDAFVPYAGQTIEVYLSMKIENPSAGQYAFYIDRVALASICKMNDNGVCPDCGKADPILSFVPGDHILYANDYSAFPEKDGQNTAYVNDADAFGGKAVRHIDSSNGISITRYHGAESKIGTLSAADWYNKGYQVHKFNYTVPADAATGGFVFVMSNWQFQSPELSDAFVPYAGQTIEVYLSMKIENPSAGQYEFYIDRVALASVCEIVDGVCDVCGKTDALLSQIPGEHLEVVRDYSYFSTAPSEGTEYVDDAEAAGGKAVRYSKSALNNSSFVSINRYDVASGLSDGHPSLKIGAISNDVLKASIGTGYQVYKFTYYVPEVTTEGNTFYIMNNWQLNSKTFCADFAAYAGKTVDVYISLKVTGPDGNGHYSLYVDRVALATTCVYDDNGVCPDCGSSISYTFLANDFTLPYEGLGCDKFVDDSASAYGKAARFSYADRVAAGDAGLLRSMLRISTQTLDMKAYFSDTNTYADIGSISIGRLNHNSGKGYVTYTFRDVVPVPTNDNFFLYVFDCWGFQVKLTEAQRAQLAGKSMDVSLSMKVEGDVTDSGNPPTYYIDKVTISGHVDATCAHGEIGVGLVSDELHGTECYLCGELLSTEEHTFDEGVENGDIITFTCSGCGYTRTAEVEKPVTGWNLELDGNISLKFVLNVTAEEAAAATVSVTVNGETTTKNVADLASGEQYILTAEVVAAQMNDTITVTLNKNGQAISKDYSVRAYADYILDEANGYNTATKNLVKYMLVYGAASQNYFDYNTENLADAGIEAAPAAVPTTGGSMDVAGKVSGIKLYGATLVHKNKIAVRFYFSGDVSGKTFTVNGEAAEVEAKGDLYFVEVADICPQDLDLDITVSVTDGNDTLSVTYAPMDYIIRMYAKDAEVAPLVQALYGYYLAAEAYLAN